MKNLCEYDMKIEVHPPNIHYFNGGNGLAAIYVQNAGKDTLYYVHTDYQGSLTALSLPNGTDPSGEWFGIDDLIAAAAGFVFGYVGYGISTGNWGWKAFAAGGMGAAMAWVGYNTAGLSTAAWSPGQGVTSATWNYVGSMAINTTANQITPPMNIPIGDHFALGVSPMFGLGASGLTGGIGMSAIYSNGDFSIGGGIGAGDNYRGWNAAATYAGWGGGYGQTSYGATEVMGQQLGAQRVGTYTGYFNHNSFSISNDLWGDKHDGGEQALRN